MRERLGIGHEARSAELLTEVRTALPAASARQLAWLDWDDVARLIVGHDDGRGALLNGRLDYDNTDNVARFLKAAGLGIPAYDPTPLARGLRSLPPAAAAPGERVYLQATAELDALGWLADRSIVYRFLHEGHHNLAAHAMLRKAVDLGAATGILPDNFFDLTDVQALRLLGQALHRGLEALVQRVRAGERQQHCCVWEAEAPGPAIPALLRGWHERLTLEQQLAQEAALAPHEVIVEAVVSRARRALPPLARAGESGTFVGMAAPPPAPRMLHVFAAHDAAPDYIRRLRLAVERYFAPLGARSRAMGQEDE